MSYLARVARLMVVAVLLTACSSGVVVKRQHVRRWLIEVQLDPSDVHSRQWMEVTKAVYNLCPAGAMYPECRGN